MVPTGRLDLIVLSHSDEDHIGDMRAILAAYRVAAIIHPGDDHIPVPAPGTPPDYLHLMRDDIRNEGARVWDLSDPSTPPEPGRRFSIGGATATFVVGWSNGQDTWHAGERTLPDGPHNNALSIVIRLEYGGHSVLLTGDTVGRLDFMDPGTCAYAERIMVEKAALVPIDSDVLIGQHHGADNATSGCFIRAVSPGYVIFSAGHHTGRHHPRQSAYDRLTGNGVDARHILRTDRGDNEDGPERVREASQEAGTCPDQPGDDDVEIRLSSNPSVPPDVHYMGASRACGRR
jgi:hypothetical protein